MRHKPRTLSFLANGLQHSSPAGGRLPKKGSRKPVQNFKLPRRPVIHLQTGVRRAARIRHAISHPARTGAAGWVSVQCAGAAEDGQHTRADRARRVRRRGARDAADAACAVRGHGMQAAGTRERTRVACEARAHARRLWNPLKTHTVAACRLRLFLFRSRIVCRTSQRCCDCVGQATVAERTQQVRRIRLPRAG